MILTNTSYENICENISRTESGELCLGGVAVSKLAEKYGTPLFVYDEDRIRERCRTYIKAMRDILGDGAKVLYASKAASFRRIYQIMKEEGMGIDVVSCGEIHTAHLAGFPMENAYFHSNNKTDRDIRYAIEHGVGRFVVDNEEELIAINSIAAEMGVTQSVLLRITPGIDPHTYEAVSTGKVDSKFGSAIETGQARDITDLALSLPSVRLVGFHCHVGSQVFDPDVHMQAVDAMIGFIANIREDIGYEPLELDIGGGYGVRYTADDPVIDIRCNTLVLADYIKAIAKMRGINLPTILIEPGRSIVADAGMTLYTVGTVKRIPGYKSYVSVDGGMTDNPRFALYRSQYTVVPVASPVGEDNMYCSVVGRCCESGDIIQENVLMPSDIHRGDLIACLTTGAYNYSMSSNYNRIGRPAVVMLSDGEDYLAVRRETEADITLLDV